MLVLLALLEGEADRALFLEFHERYERKLYTVALNILRAPSLAEEAVQDAMVSIVRHWEDFKKIFEKNCYEIAPWCVTIVKHAAVDILRQEGRSEPLDEDWDAIAPEDVEQESAYRHLVALIRAMPEQYREVLELKFVLERSNREIAEALGLTEGTVGVRIQRGRALLIRRLKQEGYSCGAI